MSRSDRARGALIGLAIGDALGMPTQSLPRDLIARRYGHLVSDFHTAADDHPLAAGLAAGSITDDTEQAFVLAGLLIDGSGHVEPAELAQRLLAWEEDMRARGSLDLLGPSTRRALDDLLAGGDIAEVGRFGTTNGSAMRIAPVGIVAGADDLEALVDLVVEAGVVTHNTTLGIAGAAAVAAAVSVGVDGGSVDDAIRAAVDAADLGMRRGSWVAGADIAERIGWAVEMLAGRATDEVIDRCYRLIGTSLATQESVPAAFGILSAAGHDPWLACRIAASVGGDTDTIGAIVGAISGACHGVDGFPERARRIVHEVNDIDPYRLADQLLELRRPESSAMPGDQPRLVALGNVVADIVVTVDELPPRGGDVIASDALVAAGGAFNVMAACARQGIPVRYAGLIGGGLFGRLVRAALQAERIEIAHPSPGETDTGFVIGIVDAGAERTFVTTPGVETTISPTGLRDASPRFGDVAYLSGYGLAHPATRAAILDVLAAVPPDTTVVFDPGPLIADLPPEAVRIVAERADWITCNAVEATALTASTDPADAARALAGRRRGAIVRVGGQGCWLAARPAHDTSSTTPADRAVLIAGYPVDAVDTNGAGDAHTGVFVAGLLSGEPIETAARRANAAAAIAVTKRGPATAPTADELAAFIAKRA